jgi:hypothetical protein
MMTCLYNDLFMLMVERMKRALQIFFNYGDYAIIRNLIGFKNVWKNLKNNR